MIRVLVTIHCEGEIVSHVGFMFSFKLVKAVVERRKSFFYGPSVFKLEVDVFGLVGWWRMRVLLQAAITPEVFTCSLVHLGWA